MLGFLQLLIFPMELLLAVTIYVIPPAHAQTRCLALPAVTCGNLSYRDALDACISMGDRAYVHRQGWRHRHTFSDIIVFPILFCIFVGDTFGYLVFV